MPQRSFVRTAVPPLAGLLILLAPPAIPLSAQQRTATDYARAESFLGSNAGTLVSGDQVAPRWLEDDRFSSAAKCTYASAHRRGQ